MASFRASDGFTPDTMKVYVRQGAIDLQGVPGSVNVLGGNSNVYVQMGVPNVALTSMTSYQGPRVGGTMPRVATVAVDAMAFHQPVLVGDIVSVYAEVVRVGRTSITMHVEVWAKRARTHDEIKVTEGRFTCVAIGDDRRPRSVPPE